jgi:hypothetical protein
MKYIKSILTVALVVSATTATADPETGYVMNLSRLSGVVECLAKDIQSDKASFECTLKLKGNKTVGIEMKKAEGSLLGERDHGFYGMDLVEEGTVAKRLVVVADQYKAVQFVSFADVAKPSDKDIRVTLAGAAAKEVKALSVNPLTIQFSDDKYSVSLGVWFTMYGTDKNTIRNAENGIIPSEVMDQIRAQLLLAR